MKEKNI